MPVGRYFEAPFAALVGVFLCAVQPAIADVSGAILGTVTDQTLAVVCGPQVLLLNANTGLGRERVTDADGSYEFLAVLIGEGSILPSARRSASEAWYSVDVEAPLFRKSEQSSITIVVNQPCRTDFRLVLGRRAASWFIEGR